MTDDDIIDLEEQGWQALSTSETSARTFYASVLHDNAIMIFPGGLRFEGKTAILASFAVQPWSTFRIVDPRVVPILPNMRILVYSVTAQREGAEIYQALISTTYVQHQEHWKLVMHQQTPYTT